MITPTPWNNTDYEDCTHPVISDPQFGECRVMGWDDYVHAMHCVNCHDDLLTAIEEYLSARDGVRLTSSAGYRESNAALDRQERALVALRDVVKKAKGEQS